MNRKSSGRFALGFAGLLIVFVVTLDHPIQADADATAGGSLSSRPGTGQPSLDWDHIAIRDCAYDCLSDQSFNICFACQCLSLGAQDAGERSSANAQCRQAVQDF